MQESYMKAKTFGDKNIYFCILRKSKLSKFAILMNIKCIKSNLKWITLLASGG